MVQKFRDLTERVGFLHDADTRVQIGAGRLDVSQSAITFEMPVDDDVEKKLGLSRFPAVDEELADRFVFRDRHGKVGLGRCRLRSSTRNIGGGLPGSVRLKAQYAVEIGAIEQDYWSANGLRSEIAGLAASRTEWILDLVDLSHADRAHSTLHDCGAIVAGVVVAYNRA